jgi:hypothetical protein
VVNGCSKMDNLIPMGWFSDGVGNLGCIEFCGIKTLERRNRPRILSELALDEPILPSARNLDSK